MRHDRRQRLRPSSSEGTRKCLSRPRVAEQLHPRCLSRKPIWPSKVKPQITPDGKVMMSIEVNKDQPRYDRPVANGNVPIDTKHVKTEVVVENGAPS